MRLEPGAVVVVDPAGLARGLSAIPDEENALLRLADGRRTVAEIARVSGRDRAEVEATLLRLAEVGVLRMADPPVEGARPARTPGPDGAPWFTHPAGHAETVPAPPPPRGGSGRAWGLAAALLLFVALLAVPLRARWSAPPANPPESPPAPVVPPRADPRAEPRAAAPSRPASVPDPATPPALLPTEPAPSAAWIAAMAEAGDQLRAGDPVRAAAACREAVRLEPSQGAGWIALGEASAAAGDRETARTAFARYLALEPDGRRAPEARAALERLRP